MILRIGGNRAWLERLTSTFRDLGRLLDHAVPPIPQTLAREYALHTAIRLAVDQEHDEGLGDMLEIFPGLRAVRRQGRRLGIAPGQGYPGSLSASRISPRTNWPITFETVGRHDRACTRTGGGNQPPRRWTSGGARVPGSRWGYAARQPASLASCSKNARWARPLPSRNGWTVLISPR